MAADELISLHERLTTPVLKLIGNGDLDFFYWGWVVPGIALVIVLALFFLKFWLNLPAKPRLTFFIAGVAIYIGGAIGFEMIGGHYAESHGMKSLIYSMITTIEESLEMAGVIVFICRNAWIYCRQLQGGSI